MGNCCGVPGDPSEKKRRKKEKKQNPFSIDYNRGPSQGINLIVLKEPTGRDIKSRYELGRELDKGEFGITYLCTDKETREVFACKSISKKKLRTAVDIEDVRREVEIMRHLPRHPNIVSLNDTYEDDNVIHLVMELWGEGELEGGGASGRRRVGRQTRVMGRRIGEDDGSEEFPWVDPKEGGAGRSCGFRGVRGRGSRRRRWRRWWCGDDEGCRCMIWGRRRSGVFHAFWEEKKIQRSGFS